MPNQKQTQQLTFNGLHQCWKKMHLLEDGFAYYRPIKS